MEKFDIEAYLDGRLTQAELDAFHREMRENPGFAKQVEAKQKVVGHLRTQLLREQVAAALSGKPSGRKPRRWKWIAGSVLLMVLAGYYFIGPNRALVSPPPAANPPDKERNREAPPHVPPTSTKEETAPTQEVKKTPENLRPIAENKKPDLLPPDYPAPNVRGQNEAPKTWQALLNKVWYTKFPPDDSRFEAPFSQATRLLTERKFTEAFVLLEMQERKMPENDTLRFLKGYCLLEMGEGADALRYFERLEDKQPGWSAHLQWYRGLGLLLRGEAKKAALQFKEVAATPGHPFQQQSQKALKLLE